jgi:hypothetical protein
MKNTSVVNTRRIVIGLAGADPTVKETLAEALQSPLSRLLHQRVQTIKYLTDAKDIIADMDMKRVFAWESEYLTLDNFAKGKSRIVCQSIVDRAAAANVAKLSMDLYFSRILSAGVKEYDVLVYCPPELSSWPDIGYMHKLDKAIRNTIVNNTFNVQIVVGDVRQQCGIVMNALKLRLGKIIR